MRVLRGISCGLVGCVWLAATATVSGQGIQAPGIGPVNRSMGGASVAAPLDSIGALHWNPATISGLKKSELAVAVELVRPTAEIQSTVIAGPMGPVFTGGDSSDSGWAPVPSVGLVLRDEDSPVTFGLGVFGIAGYSLNYNAATTNPIAFPPAPTAATPFPGLGRINAAVQVMQIAPSISWEVTPGLSIAAGPTVMLASLQATPFPFASPDDANGDGFFSYPAGTGTRNTWGGGFQAGVFYRTESFWNFGASVKSKQWMEPFTYRSANELGLPRSLRTNIEYPTIVSFGTAYEGFENLLIAADIRWTDYASTAGFGDTAGFDATGRVTGLGWRSVWSTALGAQLQVTDALALRTGYTYAQSPITDNTASFNVPAPLVLRHSINFGGTLQLTEALGLNFAYHHIFSSGVSGPIQSPLGPLPGTNVSYSIGADAFSLGLTATF